jgi:hypothetical protein
LLSSKTTKSLFLQTTLIALLSFIFIFTFTGSDPSLAVNFGFAQNLDSDIIQIVSTSTFIDDSGNFHVIGEVNNTSSDPQTNILITTILSDTTNNNNAIVVGNHSAFSSIGTLRSGELSSFDILIPDPQIVGKFNFIEFSTSSQPATIEKPANLVLNGTSAFFDNVGNPHITGNIINQGQSPEQFLNLVATFYDNSSLGIVGTQSFGLNVANLTQNQMAPFDITITDNKTKSQAAFYSLNVDSVQNSMGFPLNPKFSFEPIDGFIDSGLFLDSPLNNNPVFTNNGNINNNANNPVNDSDNDNQNNNDNGNGDGDNQRGEQLTDDDGNSYYNDENCSEESGSSGGSSSECEEAEREEESEREDEDSSETDQGPPSNSDSTGGNDDEEDSTSNDSDGGENADSNEENDNIDNSDSDDNQ